MARTDFATMFTQVPKDEQDAIRADTNAWVQLFVGDTAAEADKPVFAQRYRDEGDVTAPPDLAITTITTTRRQWLIGITRGQDLLSSGLSADQKQEHVSAGPVPQPVPVPAPKKASLLKRFLRRLGIMKKSRPSVPAPSGPPELQPLAGKTLDETRTRYLGDLYQGLGSLGQKMDTVTAGDSSQANAPVVEFRGMTGRAAITFDQARADSVPEGKIAELLVPIYQLIDAEIKKATGGQQGVA